VPEYLVRKYKLSDLVKWNSFIETSKNGTFLFHRSFMEYHKDRFEDYSLLVFKGNTLISVLPANRYDNIVASHQGLTYGGLILQENIGVAKVEAVFLEIINYLKKDGIKLFRYKSIPLVYHKLPSFELEPLLHNLSAVLYHREQNLAIDFRLPLNIHKTKIKHFKKNQELGLLNQFIH